MEMETTSIIYESKEHEEYFSRHKNDDRWHQALHYLIGLADDTRSRAHRIYDEGKREINPDVLNEGWITGSTRRTLELAFHLFTGQGKVSVDDIFNYGNVPYLLMAISLRFPSSQAKPIKLKFL